MRMGQFAAVALLAVSGAVAQTTSPETQALQADIAAGKHDNIVGHYQVGAAQIISITREGKQVFAQTGADAPFMELTPVAGGGFTAANGRAQVTFAKDAAGKVTALTLRQGANEQTSPRITDAQAAKVRADLAKRIADNKPAPGTEAILRKHIEGMRAGTPIYDQMVPALVAAVKPQQEASKVRLAQVGAIKAIEFSGVAPNGLDTFHVQYENGSSDYMIGLTTDGKIGSLNVRPGQ